MEMVERARVFATAAHAAVGQLRKYTSEPYIVHPAEVVDILGTVGITDEYMLAAAWLHDTVEDTGVEVTDIWREFGGVVASYVNWLTIPTTKEDGNRAQRKAKDRDYIRNAPPEVKTVKLADLISNCSSIIRYDEAFAKTYLEEKRLMLEVLKEGDAKLWAIANAIVGK
jgi:guanosine-3',5'-bis(diphosphate) 3'-pyrophosphohydrolase